MKEFSFFKNRRSNASNEIRVNQISEFLGGKINPKEGYESDVCIYIKRIPPINHPEKSYIDIIDQPSCIPWLLERSSIKVIAVSRITQKYISKIINRDVIFLPQHHCNYLRESRDRDEVNVVGIIGSPDGECSYNGLFDRLKKIGLNLIVCRNPRHRENVVSFYKNIDIQIAYRPQTLEWDKFHTSLKLVNASSFGIPTVAYPEKSYIEEFGGCFLSALSEEDLFMNIKKLKEEPFLYEDLSERAKLRTEKYHIENIAKLYQQLL